MAVQRPRHTGQPLDTLRLALEPLRPQHADEMVAVLADERLHDFTGGRAPLPLELAERYDRQNSGPGREGERWLNWIVRVDESRAAVGYVQATVAGDHAVVRVSARRGNMERSTRATCRRDLTERTTIMTDHSAISKQELAELLVETGHHHHQAFIETDGGDPEWPLWYAGYLQARLWDRAGTLPTRSRLVQLLMNAEAAHTAVADSSPWPPFYADVLLEALHTPAS